MTKNILVARRFDEERQVYRYLTNLSVGKETFYIQEANLKDRSTDKEKVEKLIKCNSTLRDRNYEILELDENEVEKIVFNQKVLFQW